ncbi:benzoate/H(+) symporter BenE family transporter [Arthrobacter crystallopoietes]|uniref:benzoate/H(+) symporter BenE family transporter n=1 Tax=Crystallibacter crystallopoietes TaxID=37928 RepID=UPI001FC9D01A|nr:benzoate/H(+) symporter BenE family transporter [Arthrobacter crystallopoietes]
MASKQDEPEVAGQPAPVLAHNGTLSAGIVTAVVGFTSSFAVVLTGLRGVGATPAQAASGLLALCVLQGIGMLILAQRYRIPLTLAWSTPGAALLASTGVLPGGWPTAVAAFAMVGVLVVLAGVIRPLGKLIELIPPGVASGMLAGIILSICLDAVGLAGANPGLLLPLVLVWVLGMRWWSKWATPAVVLVGFAVIAASPGMRNLRWEDLLPQVSLAAPSLELLPAAALAVPLFIVTMASQNVPGVVVMRSFGYRVPWRFSMVLTGALTLLAAPFGGHSVNLAAISGALAANDEVHSDPSRRWRAARMAGVTYLVFGLLSTGVAALVVLGPDGIMETIAALALLGVLGSSVSAMISDAGGREAALVTFVIAASGVGFAGIGAAFWALLVGLAVHLLLERTRRSLPRSRRTAPLRSTQP